MVREWCGMGRWLSVSFRVGGTRLERMGRAWHAHKRCGATGEHTGLVARHLAVFIGSRRLVGGTRWRPPPAKSPVGGWD